MSSKRILMIISKMQVVKPACPTEGGEICALRSVSRSHPPRGHYPHHACPGVVLWLHNDMVRKRVFVVGDDWWDVVSMVCRIRDYLHNGFLEVGLHSSSYTCSFGVGPGINQSNINHPLLPANLLLSFRAKPDINPLSWCWCASLKELNCNLSRTGTRPHILDGANQGRGLFINL